jgi:molybdopterin-guanine dinucleotide biosynthesis protein A
VSGGVLSAVVVLAGGRATRLPGKLERSIDGEPMLERVCRNARALGFPVYLAGSGEFSPALARGLNLPMLHDRWPGAGPLRALFSAADALDCERIFALAGDEVCAGVALFRALEAAWRDGDEAVVPRHDARIEPLAAIYSRHALVREAGELLARRDEAMHALIARLQTRLVDVSGEHFANVNTPEDAERVAKAFAR